MRRLAHRRAGFLNLLLFGLATPIALIVGGVWLNPVLQGNTDRYLASFLAGVLALGGAFLITGVGAGYWTKRARMVVGPVAIVSIPVLLAHTARSFVSHPQWLTTRETFTLGWPHGSIGRRS